MGTREKSSTRSTQIPDAMAGHGPSPGGHGAHPIHIHPARPFYRFAATGLGAAMWFFVGQYGWEIGLRGANTGAAVLQSETRHASTAWLETPMGALRRDGALHREKLRRKAPEESFGGKVRGIHRGSAN